MRFILESGRDTKTGYFGDLKFLDSQDAFHPGNPTLLSAHPIKLESSIKQEFLKYCDRGKLDIYLNPCRQYYFGNDDVNTS